ncbi:hypothetical protein Lbru_2501 [Legionella brunensis]|uniref:DUF883 domain-containing protein n=2 Tax=Legionella brunensis TaxID=29422 RepID=A0A0W0S532_9GAMM|nr:hypothetical protein Lbru_2501 [Legionella brunensis]
MDAKKSETIAKNKGAPSFSSRPKSLRESHLGEATNDLIIDSKKMANELYVEGKNRIYEAQNNIKEYSNAIATKVHEKPLISLLVAGGIGFILSSLFRR